MACNTAQMLHKKQRSKRQE